MIVPLIDNNIYGIENDNANNKYGITLKIILTTY